jgi:thiamine pyrophosphate-dependent acetolactate synthase large subunit-like protein
VQDPQQLKSAIAKAWSDKVPVIVNVMIEPSGNKKLVVLFLNVADV